ncbi:MAG: divergent PAP2 family protein [candidate division WOR-3 bacterium]
MTEVNKLLSNTMIWVPVLAMFIAQLTKCGIYSIVGRRLDLTWLFQAGGMPSSHSALVSALTIKVGFNAGFDSPLFAIAFILALIVMYDAAGVRRAMGKQARLLNMMVDEMSRGRPVSGERMKEFLGHTPLEVFVGALLGAVIAILL